MNQRSYNSEEHDMAYLGEYFAEFSAAAPKLDMGVDLSVLDVQRYLNAKAGTRIVLDGAWNSATEAALRTYLTSYNRTNNATASFENMGMNRLLLTGGVGSLIKNAIKLMGPAAAPTRPASAPSKPKAKAKAAPTTKPTAASKTGMAETSVANVQATLRANGLRAGNDGAWGPVTQNLWKALAKKKGLDPTIDRASPNSAWVVPATFTTLNPGMTGWDMRAQSPFPTVPAGAAMTVPAATVQVPVPTSQTATTPIPAAAPAAAAAATTGSSTAVVPVEALQKILKARGVFKQKDIDKKYGPKTAAAWSALATSQGLAATINRVTGTTARVSRATFDMLKSGTSAAPAATVTRPVPQASVPSAPTAPVEPAPTAVAPSGAVVPASTLVVVSLSVVQKAWNQIVKTTPTAGKALTVTGKWDTKTAAAVAKLLGLSVAAATKLLNKKKTAVSAPADRAAQLEELARRFDGVAQAQVAQAAQTNTEVSISVAKIQQALNMFNGRTDDLILPVTGVWDDKTKVGYMTLASIPASAGTGLDQRVSSDRRSITGVPAVAQAIDTLAARWDAARTQAAQQAAPQQTAPQQSAPSQQEAPPPTRSEAVYAPPPSESAPSASAPAPEAPTAAPAAESPPTDLAPAPAAEAAAAGGSKTALLVGGAVAVAGLAYLMSRRNRG